MGAPITLQFEDGQVQGSDGCNRFSAPYTSRGSTLEVSAHGTATQMACPPEVMQQAETFTAALAAAQRYRVAGARLKLFAADGAVLATFTAQTLALAATSWLVTGINNGKSAVVSVHTDSTITIAFTAERRASGSAGCNRYTADYSSAGSHLRFSAPAATRKFCAEAGLMDQERRFMNALAAVYSMHLEGDRLELRSADGALQITALQNTEDSRSRRADEASKH